MESTLELTLAEIIDRGKDGRTQTWIVEKLNERLPEGKKITEVKFSRKKSGKEDFTELELKALSKLLRIDLKKWYPIK